MDIDALQDFAESTAFNLTAPLSNGQVTRLAAHWLPEIRFHWKEKYHPISLDEAIDMVRSKFNEFPDAAKDAWRVGKWVREDAQAIRRLFDPPLVTVPAGIANAVIAGQEEAVATVRVITAQLPVEEALEDPAVAGDARITHGGTDGRSDQFFGSTKTIVSDTPHPAEGDPLAPRAVDERGDPRITVMASYKNLVDVLEYNLLTEAASDYPPDALRTGFDIAGLVIRPLTNAGIPAATLRDLLLQMIGAHKRGDPLPDLPAGVFLDKLAWDTLTRFAFLEYYLYYAYNDFERYQTAIWDNEHEGDDEGFCLVFERNAINAASASADASTLLSVPPHSIITSVHEEWQGGDEFRFIPAPVEPAASPRELREQLGLTVWVAGGSHAIYLSEGTHDLVNFGDYFTAVNEKAPWLWLVLTPAGVLALAIILHIIEHFVDTEDFTSDDGIHAGPEPDDGELEPTAVRRRVMVLPMSNGDHIYQDREILRLAAFPGLWGGTDGIVDKSPPFSPKTGRFFKKLLKQL
jgi:hypothetical protein